jgi:glycosyltransferase involved in cell wall biosynthesis
VPARIVFSGALVPDKGLDVLLHAMPLVRALVPEAELVVCGSAALWGRAPYIDPEAVAHELPYVSFRGALSKTALAEELRRAALAVVPTPVERWRETFGLVSLEAQACGTPVVATRSAGLVETLRDGETGWLVDRATPQDLAAAIVAALRAPARLQLAGRNAVRWAAGFSWEKSAAAWEDLLGSVTAAAPPGPAVTAPAAAPPVAVVTTWRQPCGLARYAERLVAALPPGRVRILAERCGVPLDGDGAVPDVPVDRCWRRGEHLDELVATVEALGVRLVHVNHHGALFGARLASTLRDLAASGIRSVVTMHAPNQIDPEIAAIGEFADAIVVHNEGVRLEVIANGVAPAKVRVVPPGMAPLAGGDPSALRREMGLQPGERLVASLGFLQPHKGFEEVIRAIATVRAQLPVQYLVLGGVQEGDAAGAAYREELLAEARRLGVADAVTIVGEYLPDATLAAYLRAADVVVLPYRTSWWEASAAAREALQSGRPVVTSPALAFADLGGAVFRTTGTFHTAAAIVAVLQEPQLAAELVAEAGRLAERTAWPTVAQTLDRIWDEALAHARTPRGAGGGPPRVAFQLREHARRTGGGDAIVADGLARHADPARVEIVVREGGRVAADAFLAHLFNFSTYADTEAHARRARELGVPYVVSAFYEDWPRFKLAAERRVQEQRLALGLAPSVDVDAYERMHAGEVRDMRAAIGFVARHAHAVVATGGSEKYRLERDFPGIRTRVVPIAVPDRGPGDAAAFAAKYGTRDFVLCVGRIEPRKNQLTLLEALADDDVDVVLASGGHAYREDYLDACRRFRRRGRTIYLPHLTDAELAGAYRAARVHALPSWYELPGLVTLEALVAGTAVVTTGWGTLKDYLGDTIPYAEPDDPAALRRAIADAAGWDFAEARARAATFGIARSVELWTALYEEVVGGGGLHAVPPRRRRTAPPPAVSTSGVSSA